MVSAWKQLRARDNHGEIDTHDCANVFFPSSPTLAICPRPRVPPRSRSVNSSTYPRSKEIQRKMSRRLGKFGFARQTERAARVSARKSVRKERVAGASEASPRLACAELSSVTGTRRVIGFAGCGCRTSVNSWRVTEEQQQQQQQQSSDRDRRRALERGGRSVSGCRPRGGLRQERGCNRGSRDADLG